MSNTDAEGAAPTRGLPDIEAVMEMYEEDGLVPATDGCEGVEADGYCPHGKPSLMLAYGLV